MCTAPLNSSPHAPPQIDQIAAEVPNGTSPDESLLMDRERLLQFKALWEQEPKAPPAS